MTFIFETPNQKFAIYLEHSQEESVNVGSGVGRKYKNTDNINTISLEIIKIEESLTNNVKINLTKNNSHYNKLIINIKENLLQMDTELEQLDGLIDTLIEGGKNVTLGYYAINEELLLSNKLPNTDIFDFSTITSENRLFFQVIYSSECSLDGLQQILTNLNLPLYKNVPFIISTSHGDTPSILFAIS